MSNITNDAASGRRPPERKRETINVNGEWLTREQIAARIQEMMAAGNTGIRELAEAADELDARLMVMAKREMEGARKRLESNRDLFEDSSEVESLLSEAGGLGERKEYESSLDASHGANALIEGRREEHYTDMISSLIEDAEGILHESRDMGIDAKGTENLLGKARNLLHRREYEEALEIARSVGELIVGTRKKHLRGGAMELLGVVKGLLDEAAGLGMETEEWQGDFKEAEGLFGTEDYEKASNALSTLRSAISNGMETRNAEQLKAALAEYIELVDRARESGLGVDEELKAGGRIEDIIRTDGYREALHAVATMRKTLLARLSSQRRRNTTKLLRERTSELNDFQRAEGREFPELREILDRAFDALEEEDLGSAEEIFAEFMKTKRDWEDRLAIERLAEEAEIVETQITPLMEAGVDVSEASRLLSSLKESISEGDVAGGGERLDTLKEEVEKLRVTKVKKLAYGKMRNCSWMSEIAVSISRTRRKP